MISYEKLFILLKKRRMKRKDLKKLTGLTYSTIHKLYMNESVTSSVLDKICLALDCQLSDIADIINDEKQKEIC